MEYKEKMDMLTDKERLEYIKTKGIGAGKYRHLDIVWLLEQAEQNQKFREALEEIEKFNEYYSGGIAAKALDGV